MTLKETIHNADCQTTLARDRYDDIPYNYETGTIYSRSLAGASLSGDMAVASVCTSRSVVVAAKSD